MIKYNRWNYETHKYDQIPKEGIYLTYTEDLKKIVNCINCDKEIEFGKTYTSKEWHTELGFGYGVCPECYEKEWERRRKYENSI